MSTKLRREKLANFRLFRVVGLVTMLGAGSVSSPVVASEDGYDLPGFGIWGPAYQLRNVPVGKRLVVRRSGVRSAATIGSLKRSAKEILVLNCAPKIEALQFEDASPEAKRELLGGVWCEIEHYGLKGFVPGVYLDPILNR